MTAYNFKVQFADDVCSGKKQQTIRARGKRAAPAVGSELQLYTGMRTKACRLLARALCKSVDAIRIYRSAAGFVCVDVDGKPLSDTQAHMLALADGFDGVRSLAEFFEREHGLPFVGDLIKWSLL